MNKSLSILLLIVLIFGQSQVEKAAQIEKLQKEVKLADEISRAQKIKRLFLKLESIKETISVEALANSTELTKNFIHETRKLQCEHQKKSRTTDKKCINGSYPFIYAIEPHVELHQKYHLNEEIIKVKILDQKEIRVVVINRVICNETNVWAFEERELCVVGKLNFDGEFIFNNNDENQGENYIHKYTIL
ncbi:uncharacterized protein LOC135923809 isoform X2 [Gordionus sp. m RMFG-2023]|uniref:uncharacterized protein LOC135923809 isoform X2 n=1 Tax=Gordionus sp. m RMFG-2023 TaxID=3053472 RepID=UPI0031FC0F66